MAKKKVEARVANQAWWGSLVGDRKCEVCGGDPVDVSLDPENNDVEHVYCVKHSPVLNRVVH